MRVGYAFHHTVGCRRLGHGSVLPDRIQRRWNTDHKLGRDEPSGSHLASEPASRYVGLFFVLAEIPTSACFVGSVLIIDVADANGLAGGQNPNTYTVLG